MWRTGWFLGTRCSSRPIAVVLGAEKPPILTAESTIRTDGLAVVTVASLLTKVMRSRLQSVALLLRVMVAIRR